jgi:hypothetical protein
MKFIRRHDLTPHTRIDIVRLAWLNQGIYGKMTQIAQDYHISRTWLYQLIGAAHLQLETLFSAQKPCVEPPLPYGQNTRTRFPTEDYRKVKILERALAPAVMHKQALPPIQLSSVAMLSVASSRCVIALQVGLRISRMASRPVIPQWG